MLKAVFEENIEASCAYLRKSNGFLARILGGDVQVAPWPDVSQEARGVPFTVRGLELGARNR